MAFQRKAMGFAAIYSAKIIGQRRLEKSLKQGTFAFYNIGYTGF